MLVCGMWYVICWYVGIWYVGMWVCDMWYVGMWYVVCWYVGMVIGIENVDVFVNFLVKVRNELKNQ
jgi:hypothetical protein